MSCIRGKVRCRGTDGGEERFGDLPDPGSELLNSKVIQKEVQELTSDFRELSELQPKFEQFDVAGKEMLLEKMEVRETIANFAARRAKAEWG